MPGYGFWQLWSVVLAVAGTALCCNPAFAQSLEAALAYAYANNPQLNAQRAQVRATDENVPTALSGYRPRASITANAGTQSLSTTNREIGSTTPLNAPATYFTQSGVNAPHGVGATVTQNLLNGFQTANRTRQAEAQVFGARETLRNIEQTVLLSAATAYMNLLRDSGILELQRSNVEVLAEQLRQAKQRLRAGQRHAAPTSRNRRRDLPSGARNCSPPRPPTRPRRRPSARSSGSTRAGCCRPRRSTASRRTHLPPRSRPASRIIPTVTMAQFNVDVALLEVKVAEGALYPTVTLSAQVQKNYESDR